MRVDNEGWEDVRPKAAVAANTGAGPDIILSTNDDANLYPDKLLDVTDLAEYLGKKYGGWYPAARAVPAAGRQEVDRHSAGRGRRDCIVYRESHVKAAGFDGFPKDTDGFLKLCQALQGKGHARRLRAGQRHRRRQLWCHWLIWAFGGKLVDKNNKVVIDSPETIKALEYAKELYATFIPGTLSWLDPNNNKAFLDGQISLTNNGISIYYAAKNSTDPKIKEMAADIQHATCPIGPVGVPTESHLFFNQMIFKYTQVPEGGQGVPALHDGKGAVRRLAAGAQSATSRSRCAPTSRIRSGPSDPKHTPYRDAVKNLRPTGYAGKLGYASAGAMADFIVVNMVAEAASGSKTPKEAAERAREARRALLQGLMTA